MEISSEEAFLKLHRWQVELVQVVLVGSLMPSHPLRGVVAVVTRKGIWDREDKPSGIWGFSLSGKKSNFIVSALEGFESFLPHELSSEIRASLRVAERNCSVLALTKTMKLPSLPRAEGDALASVRETLFLVQDDD